MRRLSAVVLLMSAVSQTFYAAPSVLVSRRFNEQTEAYAREVKTDSSGNVYLCGFAYTSGFPLVRPIQTTGRIFLTKLSPAGDILYSTMLGSGDSDFLGGCAVDSAGSVILVGSTNSTNFPVTSNAIQQKLGGMTDAFVIKVDPNGEHVVYSTYLGGSQIDGAMAVALDAAGAIYVAGTTDNRIMVNKLVPDGSFLQYSALVENAYPYSMKIAVTDLTEATVLMNTSAGSQIVKLNAAGDRAVYRTTMPAGMQMNAIASDATGFIWATGLARTTQLATPGAPQTRLGGGAYYRSSDGGATWQQGSDDLDVGTVFQVTTNAGKLYAGTDCGLFQSNDDGPHWTRLWDQQVSHFAFDPTNPETIYAVHWGGAITLAKTTDGGTTWQDLRPGGASPPIISAVAVDPQNQTTVYAAGTRVYRSDDGGATWTQSDILPGAAATVITVDPENSDVVYVATSPNYVGGGIAPSIPFGDSMLRSGDRGQTFQSTSGPSRVNGLVIDGAHPGTLYASGYYVYKTTDFGAHWSTLTVGQGLSYFVAVALDNSGALLALLSDGRLFRSDDGGASFSLASGFPVYGPYAVATTDDGVIHIGCQRGGSAIVVKLDYSGNITYATYWGGHLNEAGAGIALDGDGNVYVGGLGTSPDFPEVNAARGYSGGGDSFVLKLDPSGGVVYSTSWGGSFDEMTYAVAASPGGSVYITGVTNSIDFPAAQRGQVFLVGLQ
jgi:photosystem II stability/assembly factor-like uncharacterized protein